MDQLRSRRIQDAISRKKPPPVRAPSAPSPVQTCLDSAAAAASNEGYSKPALVAQRMEKVLEDERFADVVLVIEGRRFPCHRAMLAVCSEYFERMFGGGWAEAASREVTLDELPAEGFDELLRFCYTGRVALGAGNVAALLRLSAFLQVSSLEELCCAFVLQQQQQQQQQQPAQPPSALQLLELVRSSHAEASPRLRELCVHDLVRGLGPLLGLPRASAERAALLLLPRETLQEVVALASEPGTAVGLQPLLLQLVVEWAEQLRIAPSGGSAWLKALEALLPLLRWHDMPTGALVDLVDRFPKLRDSAALAKLIDGACSFHTASAYGQKQLLPAPPAAPSPRAAAAAGGGGGGGEAALSCAADPAQQPQQPQNEPAQQPAPPRRRAGARPARRNGNASGQAGAPPPERRPQRGNNPAAAAASPRGGGAGSVPTPRGAAARTTRSPPPPPQPAAEAVGPAAAVAATTTTTTAAPRSSAALGGGDGGEVAAGARVAAAQAAEARVAAAEARAAAALDEARQLKAARAAAATRLQAAWRRRAAVARHRQLRLQRLLERKKATREAHRAKAEERAATALQAAWRGGRQRFIGSAADVVELRGMQRRIQRGLDHLDYFERLGLQLREEQATRVQAAFRGRLARRRAAALRAPTAAAPAAAPKADDWVCPLRMCKRNGCNCERGKKPRGTAVAGRCKVGA